MARLYEFKEEEEKSCRKKFYAKNNSTRKTKVKRARAHTEYLMWHATIWQSGCFAVGCMFALQLRNFARLQTANNKWANAASLCARACVACDLCAALARSWHWIRRRCWRYACGKYIIYAPKCMCSALAMLDCQVQRRRGCDNHLRCRSNRGAAILPNNFELCMSSAKFPINIWIIVVEENLAVMRFPLLRSHTDWQHNWHFCAINCKYVRANFLPASLSGSVALRLARWRGAAIQNYRCWWIFFSFMVIACTQFGNKLLLNFIC